MNEDYNQEIYEKLSKLINLNFKAQLKGSDICFKNFYKMENIINGEENYLLTFTNKKSIRFKDTWEFINEFIEYLISNIDDFNQQYRELRHREENDFLVDENAVFEEHEYLGYCGNKQLNLLYKMRDFKKDLEKQTIINRIDI